jgi:hypothetical protein
MVFMTLSEKQAGVCFWSCGSVRAKNAKGGVELCEEFNDKQCKRGVVGSRVGWIVIGRVDRRSLCFVSMCWYFQGNVASCQLLIGTWE